MKKSVMLFVSLFILSNTVAVSAEENNADRIAEIESQIAELQAELDELTTGDETDDTDSSEILGTLESDEGTMVFKEAYIFDDEFSPSGNSILFIVDFTNTSGEVIKPSTAMINFVDAQQESDAQIFDLNINSHPDRRDSDTHKNRFIDLKDGATISFEFAYDLETMDSDIYLRYAWRFDNAGEDILVIDPNTLGEVPN